MSAAPKLQVSQDSDRTITIRRDFAAPRARLYDAYTQPALVRRWLGQMPGWSWVECTMDVRVGGAYRWAWRSEGGDELAMGGTYREIVPNERITSTEKFDQSWYEGGAVVTVAFTDSGEGTTVTTTLEYETKDIRDSVVNSPALGGMESGYAVLDSLLAEGSA